MSRVANIKKFNELFNEFYPRFIRFAVSYVRDKDIAEDFVSEAFTAYWENYDTLDEDTNARAYILTIIRNKCLNHLKHLQVKRRVKQAMTDDAGWQLDVSINTLEACNPDFLFSDEIRRIIDETLKKMPERTRRIFMMSRSEGLAYAEIADKMELSVKSIEYHMSKALADFRISLKEFLPIILFFFLIK